MGILVIMGFGHDSKGRICDLGPWKEGLRAQFNKQGWSGFMELNLGQNPIIWV
jgi:hypothetical protein